MKIILTETVEKLGQEGEVKEVANGYARNFLFPRGLAIPATAGALKQAEARIERITLGADGKPTGTTPLDVEN